MAAADGEDAPVGEDRSQDRRPEELRLGHEADLAAQVYTGEEVVHVAEVVRCQQDGTIGGHVLGPDRLGAIEAECDRSEGGAYQSVDELRVLGAGALVKLLEILGRTVVFVFLRLQL